MAMAMHGLQRVVGGPVAGEEVGACSGEDGSGSAAENGGAAGSLRSGSPPSRPPPRPSASGRSGRAATAGGGAGRRGEPQKRRSKNWSRPETLSLIQARAVLDPRLRRGGRKSELWEEIAGALRGEGFCRAAQQCKDKWEKLTAGYKEVRDGFRAAAENPYFGELHRVLGGAGAGAGGGRPGRREGKAGIREGVVTELPAAAAAEERREGGGGGGGVGKKRARAAPAPAQALWTVEELVEWVVSRQHALFRELLDAVDRREEARERMRREREERWQAEERAQRHVFHEAMVALTRRLLGERLAAAAAGRHVALPEAAGRHVACCPLEKEEPQPQPGAGPKRRSKNWRRAEVLQLIRLRGEMDRRFAGSTRRAALWEGVAEELLALGIRRDGKQCREKWDKLMAEWKEVAEGKRGESPYFSELAAFAGKPTAAAAALNASLTIESSSGN